MKIKEDAVYEAPFSMIKMKECEAYMLLSLTDHSCSLQCLHVYMY